MLSNARIAISGKSGCGNSTVSRLLANKLGLPLINYTFHSIAEELSIDFEELCRLAETDSKWDRMVDEKQIQLANQGPCVLGSRLAIWIWRDANLRIFLDAPLEIRASRIHQREGGDLDQVYEKTKLRDQRDHDRYLRLYGINNDDFSIADFVIDTSYLTPEQIIQIIIDKYIAKNS
jgi:cytidylate kinase